MPSIAICRTRSSCATRSPATCCRPREPGGINKDGLVATGLLAIADFVPGDVDKDQMIADYVNDQIDVVSKAFLGLTVACARCHDHKFDPISTEDYYALAGIFFSTRLIPGPVPGNTPLVRVPLLSPDELARVQAQDAADKRRRAELEQQLPDAADRAYVALLRHVLADQDRTLSGGGQLNTGNATPNGQRPLRGRGGKAERARRRLAGRVRRLSRQGRRPALDQPAPDRARRGGRNAGRLAARKVAPPSSSTSSPHWPLAEDGELARARTRTHSVARAS